MSRFPLARRSRRQTDRPPPASERDLLAIALGYVIYRVRWRANLSQPALAERLGLDRSAVCRWETGRRLPTLLHLHTVAMIDGRSASALLHDAEQWIARGQPPPTSRRRPPSPHPEEERHAAAN